MIDANRTALLATRERGQASSRSVLGYRLAMILSGGIVLIWVDPSNASGPGGWTWPADAPLNGQLRAQLPRIGVWSVLAPPGWRLRGSLAANVAISGQRSAPQLAGTLQADDLALRSVVDGFAFSNGQLRATLAGCDRATRLVDQLLAAGIAPALMDAPLARISQRQYAALIRVLRRRLRDRSPSRPVPPWR